MLWDVQPVQMPFPLCWFHSCCSAPGAGIALGNLWLAATASALLCDREVQECGFGLLEVFSCWFEVGAVGPAGSGTLLHPLVSPSRAAPWQELGGAEHVKTRGNQGSMNLPACSPPSPACPSICCGGVNLCRIAMLLQRLWQTPAMLPATSCPALHGWQSGEGKKKSGLIQSHSFPCKVGGWGAAGKDLEGEMFLEVPPWCFTDAKREEQAGNSAAEVAVSLGVLGKSCPPLFPRERLWLLEIGYFIGVAGAEEPERLSSSSALPRGSFQLCPSKQSEFSAGKKAGLKAARRLLCCKGFALFSPL